MSQLINQNYYNKILARAKKTVKVFVFDVDGTIKSSSEPNYHPLELVKKIITCNKIPAIITASGASALKSFASLKDFYQQEKKSYPTFIGIGNGTTLYRFDQKGKSEIYKLGLNLREVRAIIEVWKKVYKNMRIRETDLKIKGLETFKKFMAADWIGYIPEEYIDVFKQYNGRCFTEKIKVTVVFPDWEEKKQRVLVKKMQEELDKTFGRKKYLASRGDDLFLHITHAFKIDPKLHALQKIMSELDLKKENVTVFGDMPLDNDRGMLIDSKLPYTFTNKKIPNWDYKKPPFVLPGSEKSPVGSVYKAIDYLLL